MYRPICSTSWILPRKTLLFELNKLRRPAGSRKRGYVMTDLKIDKKIDVRGPFTC